MSEDVHGQMHLCSCYCEEIGRQPFQDSTLQDPQHERKLKDRVFATRHI